ncbi:DUF2357 domain-containing protein [Tumebacillus flagellatus]|uniref:DUF2357 domain-containing protein n=1 Tax=Tumebacillus flagellatus TaxID=1157490 RepID=A0A074MF34_9BACL|nr:DUF2357 domain-containing protein [Tumebacillus flagellatus]KEO84397.1 hypothetical protein EL26_04650 [Tumebacillus flagellatus]
MEIDFTLHLPSGKEHKGNELQENVEYEVVFKSEDLTKKAREHLEKNYSSVLTPFYRNYKLVFRNLVGHVSFLGKTFEVVSRKWTKEQVNQMWLEVSEQAAALLFSYRSPVKQAAQRSVREREIWKYQQWVFLRDQLLHRKELTSAWELIAREPHTIIGVERLQSDSWEVGAFDERSWYRAIESSDVTVLGQGHPLRQTAIARLMSNERGQSFFPNKMEETKKRIMFDTRENRFLKYMLDEMLQLVEWKERFLLKDKKNVYRIDELMKQNHQMKCTLQGMLSVPWLAEVGRYQGDCGNSTVLQRKVGYRQWFAFYQEWLQGIRYPFEPEEMQVLVETRDVAKIFEYWCFFQVLQTIEAVSGVRRPKVKLTNSEDEGAHLGNGVEVSYQIGEKELIVYFNKSFSRKKGSSYTLQVRPDISLLWGGKWHHFDAKFKDGYAQRDLVLRGDLERMHVYKDAIQNSNSSIALYPARRYTWGRFYESGLGGGVGVIGLRIGELSSRLRGVLERIIKGEVLDARICKQYGQS